ncbi:OLC1v1035396C1 [Oldenlandia corymbosa var. corymbosa]|uniref:OLC1v1035396C1 n=1 Tax=Oldenlandia corymbosa var. corymbosa TaxID=529605 RepID=A0AAV1CTL5_OLDCO|nr:OLC1v1035396C1 [Oldenlandia corymbosa var. corymbosa]
MGENYVQGTNADTEENVDPHYEIFLNSLKQDGNVWVVEADERNGLPKNHILEEVPDDDIRRETMDVIVENVEDVGSNICSPDEIVVGSLCKKQKEKVIVVERGMELDDEDPDNLNNYTSSPMEENNVRNSTKITNGSGEFETSEDKDNNIVHDDDDDDYCIRLETPSGEVNVSGRIDSQFREKLMEILRKPFDKMEHRRLSRDIKATKPIRRNLDLRYGREKSYSTDRNGKSYLDHYPGLRKKLEAADCHKELNLLRGFFFWLQNLTLLPEDFFPWRDESCLAVQAEDR